MIPSHLRSTLAKAIGASLLTLGLAACGGGGGGGSDGGGNGTGSGISVSGTAARGAILPGAGIVLNCANGSQANATTTAAGTYNTPTTAITYPCAGSATLGNLNYRGLLFAGSGANFTPLTQMLVEVVLAASASGSTVLTFDQFVAKIRSDSTFAANVSSPTAVAAYRKSVLDVVRTALIASGKTPAEVDVILAASANFDTVGFLFGSDLDRLLDNTASVLLNADGTVKAAILVAARIAGDLLPTPASTGATGGTGGTGSTGGTGGTGG